jgi:diguanylate cyclase
MGAEVVGTYDTQLVLLSFIVAVVASYTALNAAGRLSATRGRSATLWLIGGAFAMGTGIWSMHFIGMLAFRLPVPMHYDVPITLLSMLIAVIVSGFALFMVSRPHMSRRTLAVGGVTMGFGICAMHYSGMAAMQISPAVRYDPLLFAVSVALAIAGSTAAWWITFRLRQHDATMAVMKKLGGATAMGLAITSMHYTGMAAARFAPDVVHLAGASVIDNSWIALTVGLVTFAILSLTLVVSIYDSRLRHTATLAESHRHESAQLQDRVLHDDLTKLPNRLLLERHINQAIARTPEGKTFTVMFIDLDRFKTINDSLGHDVGDKLLPAVAQRFVGCLRSQDFVARISGDEFGIVLEGVAEEEMIAVIGQKILDAVSAPFYVLHHELYIACSIGISVYPKDGRDVHALIVNADRAMYQAKRAGRKNYQFFTNAMSVVAEERLVLESGLHHALQQEEFELYYQPRIEVQSGRILGMEALIRWRHPVKGLVLPAEFIPLAEETGLIMAIDAWVLKTACSQNRRWQEAGLPALEVAVNLSASQFRRRSLVDFVSKVLQESKLDPRYLELEFTETVVMQNAEETILTLERFNAMGIRLSIDDFGTGYSSLSYLRAFPIDKLKIDYSFVRDVITDPDDTAIVRAIIALAHSLRLRVVAEGVESEEQLQSLQVLGCDEYQGYYCSEPLPANRFAQLLEKEKQRCPAP